MASIVGEMKEVPLFKLGELDAEAMRFLYELGTKNRSYTVQEIDGRMYVNTNDLVRIKEPFPAVLPKNCGKLQHQIKHWHERFIPFQYFLVTPL